MSSTSIIKDGDKRAPHQPGQIVVGIDGSPASSAAVRWALAQAGRTGASLEVLIAPGSMSSMAAALDAIAELAGGELSAVTTRYVESNLSVALLNASSGADLIVVGTEPHGLLGGWLHAAASHYCAAYAVCPVVVVHPSEDERCIGPRTDWLSA